MMRTFTASLAIMLAAGVFASTAQAAEDAEQKKVYALIVANNSSVDEGVEPLQFADDDGARYYELFSSLADEARLLTTLDADSQKLFPNVVPHTETPTRANLREAVGELAADIEANRKKGIESEVYLVFTGHGNVDDAGEGYLSLRDGKLRRSDLFRDVVRGVSADYTHLIIDACHSYFMVKSRGGDDWKDDSSGETLDAELDAYLSKRQTHKKFERDSTVGVIVSTSGTAEVHEWSRFRAGVFSHQLRSALLGAADVDANGRITYAEIEAYLVAANAGVANPRARINVYADPPEQNRARSVVALDDYRDATTLQIPPKTGGRFHLEDARGLRYADFHVDNSLATRVVLLRDPVGQRGYYLRTDDKQAPVPLDDATVTSTQLAFAEQTGQSRGAVDEAFRTGLFSVAYGDGFYRGFVAARDKYGSSVSATLPQPADDAWAFELGAGYGVGSAFYDTDGLQHHLALSGVFRHESGWGVGPFASYGFSGQTHLADASAHRIAAGVEVSHLIGLSANTYLLPRARTAFQLIAVPTDDANYGDPLGLRGEAGLALGWDVDTQWRVQLESGLSADVVTETSGQEVGESLYLNPYVGVGVGF